MFPKTVFLIGSIFLVSACGGSWLGGGLESPTLEGRELRPAKSNIWPGSLYYVREEPTTSIESSANLQDLCYFPLDEISRSQLTLKELPDFDILSELAVAGELSGIEIEAVKAGLKGDLSNYYSYKLTNAKEISLPLVDAQNLFESRAYRDKCQGWRKNIINEGWAAYQVLSVTIGDLEFARKGGGSFNAEVSASIANFEPKIKGELKRSFANVLSGRNVVIAFQPLLRQ